MKKLRAKDRKINLARLLRPYEKPSIARSIWQLINTLVAFVFLWVLMARSLDYSYWVTLILALPSAGMIVRVFIIQHDCGHGSFFRSRRANDTLGFILGILTLYPFAYWKKTHAIHHASSGDLGRRTFGALRTLTVEEYLQRSRPKRMWYRLQRNPLVLFGIGPLYQFVLKNRLPLNMPPTWKREWRSVWQTNAAVLLMSILMWQTVGFERFLLVHIPLVWISSAIGVWLFYIQHQFEDTYWEKSENWDYYDAAFEGSSYYDLPPLLHWFTGNIGVHHLHHLSSKIPNYRLQNCYRTHPELQRVTRLTLWDSLKCVRLKLWDIRQRRLLAYSLLNAEVRQSSAV